MDGFENVSAEAGFAENDCGSAPEASPNAHAPAEGAFFARAEQSHKRPSITRTIGKPVSAGSKLGVA